jgi:hypothetical protein
MARQGAGGRVKKRKYPTARQIVDMFKSGVPIRDIAEDGKLSIPTVEAVIRDWMRKGKKGGA